MENLKLSDVRLRGCGFTLFPAAEQKQVDQDIAHIILVAIYTKSAHAIGDDPFMPTELSINDLDTNPEQIQACLDAGLLKQEGDIYHLSNKMLDILQEASNIQKQLDIDGFHYCPCHSCY